MAATNLVSYDLQGVKESFANWISNISPTDTPFVSMTGKESVQNKFFQWQTDVLAQAGANAHAEGDEAVDGTLRATTVKRNVTQILRKVVKVSDTADALSSYGRGSELAYQMEKAGAEIKRDLEFTFLNNGDAVDLSAPGTSNLNTAGNTTSYSLGNDVNGTGNVGAQTVGAGGAVVAASGARKTAGFESLVGAGTSPEMPSGTATADQVLYTVKQSTSANVGTGAGQHPAGTFTEDELYQVTEALYNVGATASIIMFHPKHAKVFSGLAELTGNGNNRQRMFDGATDTAINTYVSTLVDPLGQEFKLIPNRYMPTGKIFFFNPSDWTQMVLRAPTRVKLAKNGSYERWMIEMEVGLRHRNDFASGVLTVA